MIIAPVGVVLIGWLWQYVSYRVAFHFSPPQVGFYRLPGGQTLQWLLFAGPTLVVLASLAAVAGFTGRALYRQGQRSLVILYFALCLFCSCVFVVPGIWFIDIPGGGGVFI